MSSKPAQSTTTERVASRRNVIRAAAWTAPAVSIVVAAPAFAITSTGSCGTMTGKKTGTNFTVTVTCTGSPVRSVQIGTVAAAPDGAGGYKAQLGSKAASTQTVVVTFANGPAVSRPVTFV